MIQRGPSEHLRKYYWCCWLLQEGLHQDYSLVGAFQASEWSLFGMLASNAQFKVEGSDGFCCHSALMSSLPWNLFIFKEKHIYVHLLPSLLGILTCLWLLQHYLVSVELRISKSHKVKLSWTEPVKEDIDPILCLSATKRCWIFISLSHAKNIYWFWNQDTCDLGIK